MDFLDAPVTPQLSRPQLSRHGVRSGDGRDVRPESFMDRPSRDTRTRRGSMLSDITVSEDRYRYHTGWEMKAGTDVRTCTVCDTLFSRSKEVICKGYKRVTIRKT
jgi:hypothetical protein